MGLWILRNFCFFKTKISDSILRSVDLVLKYDESILGIEDIWKDLGRVNSIIFHSSPFDKIEDVDDSPLKIGFIKQIIESSSNCGNIHHNYFNPSIQNVTESLKFNSCLNKKLSIDVNGEIRNCPSMAKSYGNIENTTLSEAIDKQGFKDMWFINKDQIAGCKDCEFRYICTDCRAYIENPDNILSKPLKCGYNPYTAQWEEWSTNPLKQEAIEYYGMQELIKKEELK